MTQVHIREAGTKDAALVASFILKLATYEKLLDETHLNVERLRQDLHPSANPRLHCLIAELDGVPIGFAAYYLAYSTNRTSWAIHLQDIFVEEEHRGTGVGTALFEELSALAAANGYRCIEFEVLQWNKGARHFYEQLGAVASDEAAKMYLEGDVLKRLFR